MWEQYFTLPGFKGRTSMKATTAKFAAAERLEMEPHQRAAELGAFKKNMELEGFWLEWEERVCAAVFDQTVSLTIKSRELKDLAALVQIELASTISERDSLQQQMNRILASRSWRALEPFRAASAVAKRFLGLMGKGLQGG
jgi:hypothetical protein